MTEVRRVGRSAGPDRPLYLVRIENVEDLPESLPDGLRRFVVFTALDARSVSEQRLQLFATRCVELGCAEACCWGPDAGRVEFAFDMVEVDADLAGRPLRLDWITSSHEDESLDDALWSTLFASSPPYGDYDAVIAVAENEWAEDIEARLVDSKTWSDKLLAAEEEEEV